MQSPLQSHASTGSPLLRSLVIGLVAFLTVIDLFAAQAILPSLARAYDVTPAATGLAVNASTFGMAAGGLAVAFFSRRINRRIGVLLSLAVLSIPTSLLAVAPDLTVFTALRMAQGLCMSTAFALTLAHLGERCSASDGAASAAYITGNVASNLFGRLIAAAVADHLGLPAAFLMLAALNLSGAVVVYFWLARTPLMADMGPSKQPSPLAAMLMHFRNPALRAAFGIGFCILFAFIGTFTYVNFVLVRAPSFTEVRRAALAFSREIERRNPELATSKWWKEERRGVFLDYNQNAKDRTTCSAYSVRPLPDARVSAPLRWDEVPDCEPARFTVLTMPDRFAAIGDPHAGMDGAAGSLDTLLDLAARDEKAGLADAPWPPHFRKMEGEASRVAPSKAKPRASKPRERMPLLVVAKSPDKDAALAGLDRWKARHPEAAGHLAVDDVLVDSMRGRSSTWTRIRVNLRNIPEAIRPAQEPPDPDDDPTEGWRERHGKGGGEG